MQMNKRQIWSLLKFTGKGSQGYVWFGPRSGHEIRIVATNGATILRGYIIGDLAGHEPLPLPASLLADAARVASVRELAKIDRERIVVTKNKIDVFNKRVPPSKRIDPPDCGFLDKLDFSELSQETIIDPEWLESVKALKGLGVEGVRVSQARSQYGYGQGPVRFQDINGVWAAYIGPSKAVG